MSNDVVDAILARPAEARLGRIGSYLHFVQDCPICETTIRAFRVYRGRPVLYTLKTPDGGRPVDTFGPGLPEKVVRSLRSDTAEERLATIQKLIEGWLARKLSSLRLTEEERREFTAVFEKGRKDGMERLRLNRLGPAGTAFAGAKSCAVCDGANGACGMR